MNKHLSLTFTRPLMLLAAAAICACSKDSKMTFVAPDDIRITVDAVPFSTNDGNTFPTFGISGTEMTAGLYATADGRILEGYDNIPVTIQPSGETFTCTLPASGDGYPDNTLYFIYYPYVESQTYGCDATAQTPSQFFAELASNWNVSGDQSTIESVETSALMYSSAFMSEGSAHFSMEEAMSLIQFEVPSTKYEFTNTSPEIPDYTVRTQTAFTGSIPYSDGNAFFMIANPFSATLPSGSYGDIQWQCEGPTVSGETTTTVIGNGMEVIKHQLSYGDFFLADGNLLSKDAPAEEVSAAPVVGMVFQFDPERIGSGEKEALGGTAHALVVSCRTAGGENALYKWYDNNGESSRDETEIGLENIYDENDAYKTYEMADGDIEGYRNNMLIREKRSEDYANGCYPAFKAAEDFISEAGALQTTGTTGRHLPSNGQWFDILRNIGGADMFSGSNFVDWGYGDFYWENLGNIPLAMDNAMEKVSQDRKTSFYIYSYHWTSSAASESGARYLDFYDDGTAFCNNLPKSHADPIRCVLAF